MGRRALTRKETEDSIRALAKAIHEKADKLSDTERESLVNAVLGTIQTNQPIAACVKKSDESQSRRPSKIWRSR
jgi:hypothetical protein